MSTIIKHECFVAPEANLGPIRAGEYLTKVAQWLNEIAEKMKPCPEVDQIKRIGHSIESFKFWQKSHVEQIKKSNVRLLMDLETHLKELRSGCDTLEQMFSSPTGMQKVLGKRVLDFEWVQLTDLTLEIDLLDEREQSDRDHEPDWEPLEFDINHPEIYEEQEANMKAYLEKNKGINDYEMHSWVVMATGIIVDSKNSEYLAKNLKDLAFSRGGRTLVQLLEFEMKTRASEAVYEETAYEWNCEQAGE